MIEKDAYLNIRICENQKLDVILPQNIFIPKNNVLYTALYDTLQDLNLILSGLFIMYEDKHYICTPQTIRYFNQLDTEKHDYYTINVWTVRK